MSFSCVFLLFLIPGLISPSNCAASVNRDERVEPENGELVDNFNRRAPSSSVREVENGEIIDDLGKRITNRRWPRCTIPPGFGYSDADANNIINDQHCQVGDGFQKVEPVCKLMSEVGNHLTPSVVITSSSPKSIITFLALLQNNGYQDTNLQSAFLDEVLNTPEMQICWAYMHKNLPPTWLKNFDVSDRAAFKETLRNLWFRLSIPKPFEHVFVGQQKTTREVSGFHNYLQFQKEKICGKIHDDNLLKGKSIPGIVETYSYKWKDNSGNDYIKDIGSMFIGTTPEFELALYTLLYFETLKKNPPSGICIYLLDLYNEQVKSHSRVPVRVVFATRNNPNELVTAFPDMSSSKLKATC